MTKSNYTVTIGKVLLEWLSEKGWNVYYCSSAIDHDGNYYCDIDARELGRKVVRFKQSKLDAATPKTPRRGGAVHITDNHLVNYIRAELERRVRDE